MKGKIIFEESSTQIYQRIIHALSAALRDSDFNVQTIKPSTNRLDDFVKQINSLKPGFVFITNPHGHLSRHSKQRKESCFEQIKSHLVFIHHDNFFGATYDPNEIRCRFEAFQRAAENSTHFCIENSNITDLKNLSIPNAYKIFHATEFTSDSLKSSSQYNCSFIGHVLQYNNQLEKLNKRLPGRQQIATDFSMRLKQLNYKIDKSAERFADSILKKSTDIARWTTHKQQYRGLIHNTSLFFRGKLICDLARKHCIDIIGGDPSYIRGETGENNIEHHNLYYHPPTNNPDMARNIYSTSKVNLNITPLQFDSAIINRVMDIGGAGGFLLTDWRDDLVEISVHDQISYRTVDELSSKIDYFLTQERERKEIASQLHHDIKTKFTYQKLVKSIFEKFV